MGQAPGSVAGQIESDGEEPRFETPPRIEPCTRAEHPQERFLKQVLRLCGVAAEPEQKSVKWSAIPCEKSPRCSFVAGKHESGHFLVRGDFITHRIIVDKKESCVSGRAFGCFFRSFGRFCGFLFP